MILRRPTKETLLEDIRTRLRQGHTQATAERVRRIAARETDPVALRQLIEITCEALLAASSKAPRNGRPPKKELVITSDGVVDLDATPPMTAREQARYVRTLSRDHAIFHEVERRLGKLTVTGACSEVARLRCEKEPGVRKAYYKVKNTPSLKR